MIIFSIYASVGFLLITLLAINVSRNRMKHKVFYKDGDNPAVYRAIRAHGNTLEHIIPFGFGLLALHYLEASQTALAFFAYGFLIVRLTYAFAMLAFKFRLIQISATATYLFELALAAYLFYTLLF